VFGWYDSLESKHCYEVLLENRATRLELEEVSNGARSALLDAAGMWYNKALDVQNSLLDFCQHTSINDTLTFSVLRKTQMDLVDVKHY
jgi:hypothetical protein